MNRLLLLAPLAWLLMSCGAHANAEPRKSKPAVKPAPTQAPDPLRGAGPALFVTLPEIRARIRSSPRSLVLLHMWASWCPPCIQELPTMADLAESLPSRDMELLSVAMDEPTRRNAALVGRVIDGRARGALTRAIARFEDVDAFVAGLDPQWEGSIPALFAYNRTGALVGALYGEASKPELERFLQDLEPEIKRVRP
ncbi:MAG: TlpA family protein disulfide reductase [Deltaproteobacteria bacterium]|nr:TlpA family protein disulfide reductase [Deltaproteobacteria bacterium]